MAKTSAAKDTPKLNRSMLLLGFQIRVPEYTLNPTTRERTRSGYKNVIDQVQIYWSAKIFDYFGITELDIDLSSLENSGVPWTQGADQVAKYYNDLTQGAATTTVNRKAANRRTGRIKASSAKTGLSLQVPLLESKTAKGQYRRVSLLLPKFFNLVMVTQALSQIFAGASKADRRPPYFITEAGARYSLPYSPQMSTKGVIAPADCGAWLLTTPMMTTNNDGEDNIPGSPQIVSNASNGGKATA
ncbi:hypothetical protein [Anabaena azotica]|uniref:hypothetical protein n=1 Tax=Anabaena azotica TaxID=197653 RepID=UPI0039A552C2